MTNETMTPAQEAIGLLQGVDGVLAPLADLLIQLAGKCDQPAVARALASASNDLHLSRDALSRVAMHITQTALGLSDEEMAALEQDAWEAFQAEPEPEIPTPTLSTLH